MSSEQHDRVVMLTFLSVLLVPFTFTNPQIVPNLNEFVYFAEQKKKDILNNVGNQTVDGSYCVCVCLSVCLCVKVFNYSSY